MTRNKKVAVLNLHEQEMSESPETDPVEADRLFVKTSKLLTALSENNGLTLSGLEAETKLPRSTLIYRLKWLKEKNWLEENYNKYTLTKVGEMQYLLLKNSYEINKADPTELTSFDMHLIAHHPDVSKNNVEEINHELEEWYIKGKQIARKYGTNLRGAFDF